jgi:hypothetical protein
MASTIDVLATLEEIEIGATGVKEIAQNVKTILSTVKGTVPLDRDFGLDPAFIDAPVRAARALFAAQVVQAIKKYEPRVEVVKLIWKETASNAGEGKVIPGVRIRIKEGIEIE